MIIYRDASEKYIANYVFFVDGTDETPIIYSDELHTIPVTTNEIGEAMPFNPTIRVDMDYGYALATISAIMYDDNGAYVAITMIGEPSEGSAEANAFVIRIPYEPEAT